MQHYAAAASPSISRWIREGVSEEHVGHRDGLYDHAKAAASIHSDSWGGNTPAFDVQTNQVDSTLGATSSFCPCSRPGTRAKRLSEHPQDSNGKTYKYTDGRGTLGNPTNAKNCVSIGAALSDNSEPIDNSTLKTKLGDIWDNRTDWTWQVDIGGSGDALEQLPHPRLPRRRHNLGTLGWGPFPGRARCGGRESGGSVQHDP